MSELASLFAPDAVTSRVLPVPGARNLRDMGGYPAADGRRVRRGVLLRGGHLGGVAVEHHPRLTGLGLAAIVDLRTTEERAGLPFPDELTGPVEYWTRDYNLSRGDIVAMLRDPATTRDDMWQRMLTNYRRFPQEQHEGIGAALRLLTQGRVPLLVNCTAGKDRTGVTAAIILSALGVPREVVRADYALTEELHDPSGQLFEVDPEGPFAYLLEVDPLVWTTMMRSAPEFIDAMLAGIDTDHGGIETYLAQAHDIGPEELDAMRAFLLED